MVTLTAEYLDDIGRVRVTAGDLLPNVRYRLQRNTAFEPTWVDVRGGGNISTVGVTAVSDYEYTPNMVNNYQLLEPVFYDSFNRDYPTGGALAVTGNVGSRADTPDAASLDVTGDIDIRVVVQLPNYSNGVSQTLVAKYLTTGNQRSYAIRIDGSGTPFMLYSLNGSSGITALASTTLYNVGVIDGDAVSLRVTRVSATGLVTFYIGNELDPDASVWTQIGTTIVATSGALFAGTALLETGSLNSGASDRATGSILAAQVRNGIAGAIVANPDYTAETPGTLSFVDSTGKTWTVQGDASIIEYGPLVGTAWGVADTGQTWNVGSTTAGYGAYVQSGVGVIQSLTPGGAIGEMMSDQIPGAENAEVTWSALYPDNPALLTESVEWGVGLRAIDFDNQYESNLQFRDSVDGYEVRLRIGKRVADIYTVLSTVDIGTWSQNEIWYVRFRVEGSTLSARAWTGDNEPDAWTITAVDTSIVAGTAVYVRAFKDGGVAYKQYFGPIAADSIPADIGATASITPVQAEVWLKSITYPLLNRELDCVDWDALTRNSRAGFFNIKGRHEILGITDVGSSATFNITFVSNSRAENRAIVALLTYGGVLYLQPPGDSDEDCQFGTFSGTPGGYVIPSGSVQNHSIHGQPIWEWTVQFTRVAPSDVEGVVPTTITWEQLWAIIGPDGTWEDVWATWSTWQELWETVGSADDMGGGVF